MQRKTDCADDEDVLLYNKPDKGGVIPLSIVVGMVLLFFVPLSIFFSRGGLENVNFYSVWDVLEDAAIVLIFLGLPGYIVFVGFCSIVWELMGKEIVSYSESNLCIRQKVIFVKTTVVPWDSITDISPYDEPFLYVALPTRDPTVCITYKRSNNKTGKVYFGYHLKPKQQEYLVERIREILLDRIA